MLDPSRITLSIGRTGYDGDTFKRDQLMDRHGVQINKTSRNTVLFMTNIGTARSSVAFLVEVLVKVAGELDEGIDAVSATFVTPYPPGFPVLVPGQVFSREILAFIRELDTPEIHGYTPEFGYRVYTKKAIATCTPTTAVRTSPTNGNGALPHPPQESFTP